jgi:hypothetical protein
MTNLEYLKAWYGNALPEMTDTQATMLLDKHDRGNNEFDFEALKKEIVSINDKPKQAVLNVLAKTCYCAAIPESHDPLRCERL